jgi:hypothetical protein
MASVLLVTDRHSVESALAPVLEDAGHEVVACPGPQPSDYLCMGSRCGTCPLAALADVIVLDADVAGDRVGGGTSSRDLVRLYRRMNRPVVLLADPIKLREWHGDPGIIGLPASAGPRTVLSAVTGQGQHHYGRAAKRSEEPDRLAGPKRWFAGTNIEPTQL